MTLASYEINCVFNVGQLLWNPWRVWPMSLASIVSDVDELATELQYCNSGYVNQSKCAQQALDDYSVIYQTYFLESKGPVSVPVVAFYGKLRFLKYTDENDSHLLGRRLVGNVLPLTTGIYLATDWHKGTVTTFIAPPSSAYKATKMTPSRRGHTVSLSKSARIGGITRDDKHLIAKAGSGPEIHFYRLDQIIISDELVVKKPIEVFRTVRPYCFDESGQYQPIILNEIEYEPKSKKLWGVQGESARIIEFDLDSGKCVGELNLVDALKSYAFLMNNTVLKHLKFKPDVNQISILEQTSFTVVNGINFIADNWLLISVANITTRFIARIQRN